MQLRAADTYDGATHVQNALVGIITILFIIIRAALLTGQYPQRVGLAGEEGTPR